MCSLGSSGLSPVLGPRRYVPAHWLVAAEAGSEYTFDAGGQPGKLLCRLTALSTRRSGRALPGCRLETVPCPLTQTRRAGTGRSATAGWKAPTSGRSSPYTGSRSRQSASWAPPSAGMRASTSTRRTESATFASSRDSMYRAGRRPGEASLRRTRQRGFLPGQAMQPRVLRAQPRQFTGHLRRNLTPDVTSTRIDHRTQPRASTDPCGVAGLDIVAEAGPAGRVIGLPGCPDVASNAAPRMALVRQEIAAFRATPNSPTLSADGHTMVWYPEWRLANFANPSCPAMSSTSMTPPGGIAEAVCSISNSVFLAVCRLSWMNIPTWPTSATSGGSRCLLEPSRYDQRARHSSVMAAPVSACN